MGGWVFGGFIRGFGLMIAGYYRCLVTVVGIVYTLLL